MAYRGGTAFSFAARAALRQLAAANPVNTANPITGFTRSLSKSRPTFVAKSEVFGGPPPSAEAALGHPFLDTAEDSCPGDVVADGPTLNDFMIRGPLGQDWTSESTYTNTRRPIDEASTLPGSVYHDESFYALEQERVWRASWVAGVELTELANPGDVLPVNIGGANIILANDRGTIRGFHNVCSHRGAQLISEKCTKRRTILCPYHRWGYALDGRLMGTPQWDADEMGKAIPEKLREKFRTNHVKKFDKTEMGLKPVAVDTALGLAWVNVDGEAPPLKDWLGDLLTTIEDYLPAIDNDLVQTVHKKTYDIKANWKVLIENYLEYYHLPAVHPELCDVSGVNEHDRAQGTGMYMCFKTDPLTKGGTPLDPGRLPDFPGISDAHKETAYHICIFPNTFFSIYPDNFFRVVLSPRGPERTVETATLISHQGAIDAPNSEKLIKETYEFWDQINSEDIWICEKVQTGTSAPTYQGGRFSYRFEETLHRFQNMIVDKITAGKHKYRIPNGDSGTYRGL